MKTFLKIFFALLPALSWGQTKIYRSLQAGQTNPIWSDGGSRTFSISGDTIYFSTNAPDTMGLGDVVSFDTTGNSSLKLPVVINKRIDATRFIVKRTQGATVGNFTGKTLWDVDRAYTTMSDVPTGVENSGGLQLDGTSRNLVTLNQEYHLVCYNGQDSVASSGVSWGSPIVTGPSNKMVIYSPVTSDQVGKSQRHTGKYAGYGYKLFRNSTSAGSLFIGSNGTAELEHVEIDGISFKTLGTGAQTAINMNDLPADGFCIISNCVIVGSDSVSTQTGAVVAIYGFGGLSGSVIKVSNTIIYGFKTAASTTAEGGVFTGSTFSGTITANNVTGYKNEVTYSRGAGTMTTNNCIAQRTANGWNGTIGGNYNISDLSSDAPGANSQNSTTVSFVSASTGNYLLAAASNGIDDGTDLSGGDPAVTTDILGTARPVGAAYDIGAHEFQSAQAPTRRRVIIIGGLEKYLLLMTAALAIGWRRKK